MKRKAKGEAGYLNYKKKVELLITIFSFGLVAALLILGIVQTKQRLNLLTVVAALGAIPACKRLVELIVRFPYCSIAEEKAEEIREKTPNITVIYDMILTSSEKVMPVDCIAISEHTICGYAGNPKVDMGYAGEHLKKILKQNGYQNASVKIFDRYPAFLTRAEGMNSIAAVENQDCAAKEKRIADIILNVSM